MSAERPTALIHSYLKDRGGKKRPDRLTRSCLLAACELKRKDEIGKVCITVTQELALPMVARLKLIGRFADNEIVVRPQTVTTNDEVRSFKKITKEFGWTSLKTIAVGPHLPRIKNDIARHFGEDEKVTTVAAEDILCENPRFSQVLNDMKSWPELTSLKKQEVFFQRISNIPVLGDFVLNTLPRAIPGKVKIVLQSLLFRLLEKDINPNTP